MPFFTKINTTSDFLRRSSWIVNRFFVNYGYVEDGPGNDLLYSASPLTSAPLVDSPSLKKYFKEVSNQYSLSSCVGNATADAFEAQIAQRKGIDPSKVPNLSRLFIYWNARNLQNPPSGHKDSGTRIRLAFDSLARYGAPSETTYPYVISKVNDRPTLRSYREAVQNRISKFYRIDKTGNERIGQIKQALSAGCPVVFGTKIANSFKAYRGGTIYLPKDSYIGGHAMVLIGWSEEKQAFELRNSWGCYDDQTEVLTNNGWKLFKNVSYDDEFASLNQETHHLEFQKASKLHEYDFNDKLYYFKNQGVDLAVTPNHRMYITTYNKKNSTSWHIRRADDTYGNICFKKDAINKCKDTNYFNIGDKTINANTWLEFMGYFLSEGSTTYKSRMRVRNRIRKYNCVGGAIRCKNTGRFITNPDPQIETKSIKYIETYKENYYRSSISQTIGENADKIENCLNKLPFKFAKQQISPLNKKKIKYWNCSSKSLYEYLSIFGKAHNKFIPKDLLKLSKNQSKILLDALMLGDGTRKNGKYVYYTSSKQLADDVQILSLRCGLAADISITNRVGTKNYKHIEYKVNIKTTKTKPLSKYNATKRQYNGKVYCVTVPNGLLYVRRNGKAVWCGNSNWGNNGYGWIHKSYIASNVARDFWVPTI